MEDVIIGGKILKMLINERRQKGILSSPLGIDLAIASTVGQSITISHGNKEEKYLSELIKRVYPNCQEHKGKIRTLYDNNRVKVGIPDHVLFFEKQKLIMLVEEKRRDNHCSKQKEGEARDLLKKAKTLQRFYPEYDVVPCIFILFDIDGRSSESYYKSWDIKPFYGADFFKNGINGEEAYNELLRVIESEGKPALNSFNLDRNVEENIKDCLEVMNKKEFRKILNIDEKILSSLSPEKKFINRIEELIGKENNIIFSEKEYNKAFD